jgi:hypothetical protein
MAIITKTNGQSKKRRDRDGGQRRAEKERKKERKKEKEKERTERKKEKESVLRPTLAQPPNSPS